MWAYVIWAIILVIIIAMLVRMRSLFSIYVCPKCKNEFTLTPIREFIFPQVMYKKFLRCPNCNKIVAAAIIRNQTNLNKLEEIEQEGKPHNQRGKKKKTENKNK